MSITWTDRCQLSAFFFIFVFYFLKIRIDNIIVFFSLFIITIIFFRIRFSALL